jgi:hypothetical protein
LKYQLVTVQPETNEHLKPSTMKNLLLLLLSAFLPLLMNAQTTITWKGGTPGQENQWNEPQNWDAHRIPNENDRVVIKMTHNGHFSQPVINTKVHIAWLEIYAGAELTLAPSGQLTLDGTYTYSEGISMYGGHLSSAGEIIFKDIEFEFIAALSPVCLGERVSFYSQSYGYEFSVVSSLVKTY